MVGGKWVCRVCTHWWNNTIPIQVGYKLLSIEVFNCVEGPQGWKVMLITC